MEHTGDGMKIHHKVFKTEHEAQIRLRHLHTQHLLATSTANVRKRSKDRCECLGECDRGHLARCGNRRGEEGRIPGGAKVTLSVVQLNHNEADLREENLRVYCQLCRLYHDAEIEGADPLFTLAEIGGHDGS